MSEDARISARSRRNLIFGLALAGLVILVFLITLVRLGPDVLVRPL